MPYLVGLFAPTPEVWATISCSQMAKLELDLDFAYRWGIFHTHSRKHRR